MRFGKVAATGTTYNGNEDQRNAKSKPNEKKNADILNLKSHAKFKWAKSGQAFLCFQRREILNAHHVNDEQNSRDHVPQLIPIPSPKH